MRLDENHKDFEGHLEEYCQISAIFLQNASEISAG